MTNRDPATRYRTGNHVTRHIYDTWEQEPQAGSSPGDREVAITFDPELAPVIVAALNDREQARAHAADDLAAVFDQQVEALRDEFSKQVAVLERTAAIKIGRTMTSKNPTVDLAEWTAIDAVARALIHRVVTTAIEVGTPGWYTWPSMPADGYDLVCERARTLVQVDDADGVSSAVEFLAGHTGKW